jgi:hypothetical protein
MTTTRTTTTTYAPANYAAQHERCTRLMAKLTETLAEHKARGAASLDWGYGGDLAYVNQKLTELLESFGGPGCADAEAAR